MFYIHILRCADRSLHVGHTRSVNRRRKIGWTSTGQQIRRFTVGLHPMERAQTGK